MGCDGQETDEWAIQQLRQTANLWLGCAPARWLDFLMFHGDSRQIEHHLWPAMSFVNYSAARHIVKSTCAEFGVPYIELGFWEGYSRIWQQVCQHSCATSGVAIEPENHVGKQTLQEPNTEIEKNVISVNQDHSESEYTSGDEHSFDSEVVGPNPLSSHMHGFDEVD